MGPIGSNYGIDRRIRGGLRAIDYVAQSGNKAVLEHLLSEGAEVYEIRGQNHPLVEAADRGHSDAVNVLLEKKNMSDSSNPYERALLAATKKGFVQIAKTLMGNDYTMSPRSTAMTTAAENGQSEILELMLQTEKGKKIVNSSERVDRTPLSYASEKGSLACVDLLLKNGARLNNDRRDPLIEAAKNGHLDVVKTLINAGADVNKTDGFGRTALMVAAEGGHTEVVKELTTNEKVDVNKSTANRQEDYNAQKYINMNAIRLASSNGHSQTVSALVDSSKVVASEASFCIGFAAKKGQKEVVRTLLDKGNSPRDSIKSQTLPVFDEVFKEHVEAISKKFSQAGQVVPRPKHGNTFYDKNVSVDDYMANIKDFQENVMKELWKIPERSLSSGTGTSLAEQLPSVPSGSSNSMTAPLLAKPLPSVPSGFASKVEQSRQEKRQYMANSL